MVGTGIGQPRAKDRASSHSISAASHGRAEVPGLAMIAVDVSQPLFQRLHLAIYGAGHDLSERLHRLRSMAEIHPVVHELVRLGVRGHVSLVAFHHLGEARLGVRRVRPGDPRPLRHRVGPGGHPDEHRRTDQLGQRRCLVVDQLLTLGAPSGSSTSADRRDTRRSSGLRRRRRRSRGRPPPTEPTCPSDRRSTSPPTTGRPASRGFAALAPWRCRTLWSG